MQIGRDARLVLRLTREEKGSVGEKKRNGKRKQQMDIKEYRKKGTSKASTEGEREREKEREREREREKQKEKRKRYTHT